MQPIRAIWDDCMGGHHPGWLLGYKPDENGLQNLAIFAELPDGRISYIYAGLVRVDVEWLEARYGLLS